MPINESSGKKRSHLTKEQRREAEASIYGPTPKQLKTMIDSSTLTPEMIEQLRALLAGIDGAANKPPKEFDLNNPPKVPYSYQAFPCIVYHHGKRQHRVAKDQVELEEAMEYGWVKEPFRAEADTTPQAELSATDRAEIDVIDKKAREKKAK